MRGLKEDWNTHLGAARINTEMFQRPKNRRLKLALRILSEATKSGDAGRLPWWKSYLASVCPGRKTAPKLWQV